MTFYGRSRSNRAETHIFLLVFEVVTIHSIMCGVAERNNVSIPPTHFFLPLLGGD